MIKHNDGIELDNPDELRNAILNAIEPFRAELSKGDIVETLFRVIRDHQGVFASEHPGVPDLVDSIMDYVTTRVIGHGSAWPGTTPLTWFDVLAALEAALYEVRCNPNKKELDEPLRVSVAGRPALRVENGGDDAA